MATGGCLATHRLCVCRGPDTADRVWRHVILKTEWRAASQQGNEHLVSRRNWRRTALSLTRNFRSEAGVLAAKDAPFEPLVFGISDVALSSHIEA